jgi:hypothetical protein
MAWENRLALDMILADLAGVCVMIGVQCCTCILTTQLHDSTITNVLLGLIILANDLAENSGIDDPFH